MQKIATSKKLISNDNKNLTFKLTLFESTVSENFPTTDYTIVSETDSSMAIMPAGQNLVVARFMFNFFFEKEVLPENLEAIAEDISKGISL